MKNKKQYQSLTAQELSKRTGVPLKRVEELMARSLTLEEISEGTGIPLKEIKKRACKENWPYIETPKGGDNES